MHDAKSICTLCFQSCVRERVSGRFFFFFFFFLVELPIARHARKEECARQHRGMTGSMPAPYDEPLCFTMVTE